MTATPEEQLSALREITGQLGDRALDHWLFGGWAVDFYIGRVTRPHGDIDLAVWEHDRGEIEASLTRLGWSHAPAPGEDGGTGFERGGVRLELTYILEGRSGEVLIAFRGGPALWTTSPFGNDVRELSGVTARVIQLDVLRRSKSSPRHEADQAAVDRADSDALARLTS